MAAPIEIWFADDPASLAEGLAAIDDLDVVGVDVERADSERYWRAAALIQVGGAGRVVLVDPLAAPDGALLDLTPLSSHLEKRVTVLHAMDNDLTPLDAAGVRPRRVEDTAVAAALLGMPTGLTDLLANELDIELDGDKQAMQRADWAARPLTGEMRAYAAGDVAHLPELWHVLENRLREHGRYDWYTEERDWVVRQPAAEERRHWTRTRGVGRLDRIARARARSLWETRERLARDTDTAPGRILADRLLVELATEPVTAVRELARRGVRRAAVRRFGEALFGALDEPGDTDPTPRRPRMGDEERALVDELRSLRSARARELDLDPGVLCPNRVLAGAVLARPSASAELREALGLRDWQWQLVGADFCAALDLDGPGKPHSGTTSAPSVTDHSSPD